jgi:hypothetical protein
LPRDDNLGDFGMQGASADRGHVRHREGSAPGDSSSHPLLRFAALAWWFGWHVPICAVNYYGVLAAERLWFALAQRRSRERAVTHGDSQLLVSEYHANQISIRPHYLSAAALDRLEGLLRDAKCREVVAARKRDAAGDPDADYFHLSQEPLSPELCRRILDEVFPADFVPAYELARGRALRCHSITYHETDPSDPLTRVGETAFNAHPFHSDGNPKFAKALLYLSNVGEASGPFEIIPGSRFARWDELLRLAYSSKRARRSRIGRRLREHLPAALRRPTHLWDLSAAEVERRYGKIQRALGPRGTFVVFEGMNLHNGSRDQKEPREVLHFIVL